MEVQPVIEKAIALSAADKIIGSGDIAVTENIVAAGVSSFAAPMIEKQFMKGMTDRNTKLFLDGAITSLSLWAYDYSMNGRTGSVMNYVKKGFGAELYKGMK